MAIGRTLFNVLLSLCARLSSVELSWQARQRWMRMADSAAHISDADMKLSTLKALMAAVEEGSLRSAARRLGVSQPALTKSIRELELDLGTTLLHRTSRGVQATAQGKVLYDRALKATRELSQAADEIQQLNGRMVGDLHISAVPVAVMLLIPELLRTFGQAFPEVRLAQGPQAGRPARGPVGVYRCAQ